METVTAPATVPVLSLEAAFAAELTGLNSRREEIVNHIYDLEKQLEAKHAELRDLAAELAPLKRIQMATAETVAVNGMSASINAKDPQPIRLSIEAADATPTPGVTVTAPKVDRQKAARVVSDNKQLLKAPRKPRPKPSERSIAALKAHNAKKRAEKAQAANSPN